MMYERALQKKDVISLEMYKLYEFAMSLAAKAKNLLLIIQKVIFLKIDILAKT